MYCPISNSNVNTVISYMNNIESSTDSDSPIVKKAVSVTNNILNSSIGENHVILSNFLNNDTDYIISILVEEITKSFPVIILNNAILTTQILFPFLEAFRYVPIDGIEPPTFALQERRSTTKPNRHFLNFVIRIVFSDSNKLTLFITKVFGYRPGNNSSAFNVSTHEGAGTFQALANKELTSPKANWASGL
ncbi:hypothetical protein H8356DRAFT_1344507 [Neocallimastix lanati (nom. inval.)]|nr:hypothetical protein H8356DRAFT_1344507 [Neocallimastix sp. JGI-2020a]